MQKLENNTLQTFIENFIEELKRENKNRSNRGDREINIPFVISSLYQSFSNDIEKYKCFADDLEKYSDYTFGISDSNNEYNGIIDIDIALVKYFDPTEEQMYTDYDYSDFNYQIRFTYDERNYGYCECTPDMQDYREDKGCCGHGCDASFCEFSLHKVLNIVSDSWHGDKHDYWEFEDEFYASDKELAEKKAEEDKARMIEELKNRIEADQKKLAELESD